MEDIGLKDNTNRNFKGQLANEDVLCFCRKHWVSIIHYLAALPIFWAFFIWFSLIASNFGVTTHQTLGFLFIIGGTYLHHRIFIRLFNYYLQIMIVTNFRIIEMDKTVFFNDSRDTLDVKEIQDMVMKKSGLLCTLLDYGDIEIHLSSVTEPRVITYVPNPEYHFRKIHKTKRAYISGRQQEKAPFRLEAQKEAKKQFEAGRIDYPEITSQESQVKATLPWEQEN